MTRSCSIPHLVFWSALAGLSFGCSSSDGPGQGTGGTGQAATGGTSGSATGGASGLTSTGGSSGTTASGGSSMSGSGGTNAGTGGSGGTAAGSGGMAGSSAGGASAGTAGSSAGGASAGMAGSSAGGASAGMAGSSAGGASAGMAGSSAGGASAGMAGSDAGSAGTATGGSAGSGSSGMSSGCGKMPTIASGMYNNGSTISITAANIQRRYILNVPTNYDNTKPYKLIIAFHQLDGNDAQMYAHKYYHLLDLANNSAIFVAPNGQKNGSPCTSTDPNRDSGCGWPNPQGQDVALADAVVAQIEENFCVNTNRIFATGWSYGGSMSYKTACERGLGGTKDGVPGYLRAIAVYSGSQLSGNCTPTTPVAYFASHGTHDGVLNYSNGVGLAQNFAKANGCNWMTPTAVNSGAHVCTDEMGCMMDYPVRFCSFNGDHTPDPDNGQGGNSWVYQEVWDFFSKF